MILVNKDKKLSLQEMKRSYELVRVVRGADKDPYTVSRTLVADPEAIIVSKAKFDSLISGFDANALTPVWSSIEMDIPSAAIRAEEMFHLVLGLSNFPGTDDPSPELTASGFEKKIVVKGTKIQAKVENLTSADGKVVASSPVLEPVSARKAGGTLDVVSVDAATGEVTLEDGGVAIADGVAVELTYSEKEYAVIFLRDQHKKTIGVLLALELNDYLVANAA